MIFLTSIFVQIPFVKACCKDEMELVKMLYLTISAVKNTMMPEKKSFTMTSLRYFWRQIQFSDF